MEITLDFQHGCSSLIGKDSLSKRHPKGPSVASLRLFTINRNGVHDHRNTHTPEVSLRSKGWDGPTEQQRKGREGVRCRRVARAWGRTRVRRTEGARGRINRHQSRLACFKMRASDPYQSVAVTERNTVQPR